MKLKRRKITNGLMQLEMFRSIFEGIKKQLMKKNSHNTSLCLLIVLCFFTGCGVYNSQFQCRGGKGLNCVAAGEVVDLIVEREEGEDLFFRNSAEAKRSKEEQKSKETRSQKKEKPCRYLIMIRDEEGNLILSEELDENAYH